MIMVSIHKLHHERSSVDKHQRIAHPFATLQKLIDFFFFQAEDGIRDYKVTGVQTCALPISESRRSGEWNLDGTRAGAPGSDNRDLRRPMPRPLPYPTPEPQPTADSWRQDPYEIGRASCRERV